ncbi:DUF115 domain-containing protein [Brucepastera parasyntrophica]|uniref:motility associated factor glycosyltransferase family protein n=1 Tax=Brucepastera parasyntrophica TaxID=2880008 RepID=UPI00210B134F|nr:6-hydroxymethylpterin diphosphokinase MptE-like protein [Brucepastera parasyntrophica]ULQ60009.1 DUF115 domain-containing protein [Brucepastera parasyntrophica]
MIPSLQKNLAALEKKDRNLADCIRLSAPDGTYKEIAVSKTGVPVPVFCDGTAAHSLYNPVGEAKKIWDTMDISGAFILFAGIGGAYHIREYLARLPDMSCIIAEQSPASLKSLFEIIDLSDILADPRVSLLTFSSDNFVQSLMNVYLPVLYKKFQILPLRPWLSFTGISPEDIEGKCSDALKVISADFSVQAHFGKIWMRNIFLNLKTAAMHQKKAPDFSREKTAYIAAAGPGLERDIPKLRSRRDSYILFSTDTAWNTLASYNIIPDVFISIDAQAVSVLHAVREFGGNMTVILDLCANPDIAFRALTSNTDIIFAAGGHPLARYAAAYAPLPLLDTSAGTVTGAALDAACSLGFKKIEFGGADFAYTDGKPYARGTYLSDTYGTRSDRLNPEENLFTGLMFRTPVRAIKTENGIIYSTQILDSYAESLKQYKNTHQWNTSDFRNFPFEEFVRDYQCSLETMLYNSRLEKTSVFYSLLPFAAWYRIKHGNTYGQNTVKEAFELALKLIERYTLNHEG